MPMSPAEVAARATTFQIAAETLARGASQESLRRSTVIFTGLPSGPVAVNLTCCAMGRHPAQVAGRIRRVS